MKVNPKRDKPAYCYESGCPLATKAKGFCLGYGDPKTARIAIHAEAPGSNEIVHILRLAVDEAEIARRRAAYPDIPTHLLLRGAPLVGKSGALLEQWILRPAGLKREDLYLDNVLRCLPPKGKNDSHYPIGEDRKQAEKLCRHYDRWDEFDADIAVATLHPAGLLREPTPLPLVAHPQRGDMRKARDFAEQGYKVRVLMGGKAVKQVLGYGETVTRYRGHYTFLKGDSRI